MKDQGQLLDIYLKWKVDPATYGAEMSTTIDKIINSTLSKQSLVPVYRKIEDRDDLLQDLRLLCLQKLHKIEEPTNKRIFNFLRVSISLALKDKARKVGKRLDRENTETSTINNYLTDHSLQPMFHFGDQKLETVATLLASGYNKQEILRELKMTRTDLEKELVKLRTLYSEKE